jgi:apolipoprotein D and lipocalin family protein
MKVRQTNVKVAKQGTTMALLCLMLSGCLGYPENITPVGEFELTRYLGKWYEIARLDHSFERNLSQVTAEYSLRPDGGVDVVNRGYNEKKNKWKQALGKAYFAKDDKTGYLKVSFFGPFYGSYVIFELDRDDYRYAFISGPNMSYLWFISRSPNVDDALLEYFYGTVRELGFDTDDIIRVAHP